MASSVFLPPPPSGVLPLSRGRAAFCSPLADFKIRGAGRHLALLVRARARRRPKETHPTRPDDDDLLQPPTLTATDVRPTRPPLARARDGRPGAGAEPGGRLRLRARSRLRVGRLRPDARLLPPARRGLESGPDGRDRPVRAWTSAASSSTSPARRTCSSSTAGARRARAWRGRGSARTRRNSLAREGKAVVWIDGGMHATEKAHAQMTTELAYRIATEETAEMQQIRDEVVTLLMPVMNPDGLDIVVDWYRRNLGTPFETTRSALALPPLRRPRQQPGLVHEQHAGDLPRLRGPVQRVVPADRLQPPPDRPVLGENLPAPLSPIRSTPTSTPA